MKILIVDDEVPIRKYITQMVRQCGEEYEILASVGSGKAALEVFQKQVPDLVLADITMPKMNGLELLEKIKKEHPEVSVFMLTCHDDFEFARSAIKLQADNYILKDEISHSLMENLLHSARRKKEQTIQEALQRLESDSFFIQLMEGEDTLLFDSYDFKKHRIFLKDQEFLAVALGNSSSNLQRIVSFQHPLLQNQEIFPYHEYEIIMIANLAAESGGRMQERLQELTVQLGQQMDGPVGVSNVYYKISMLRKAVLEASAAYGHGFYRRNLSSVCREDVNLESDPKRQMQTYKNQAYALVAKKQYKKLFEVVDEMLAYAVEVNANVYLLKKYLQEILTDYILQAEIEMDNRGIRMAATKEELTSHLDEIRERSQAWNAVYSQAVADAIDYMEIHYQQNLTLSEVAEAVHLNQDYFSRRFKKETGKKFSEYLLQLRMEEARRLLLSSEYSITDIAREVGFNNDSYFSVKYKRVYGENPNETRKNR